MKSSLPGIQRKPRKRGLLVILFVTCSVALLPVIEVANSAVTMFVQTVDSPFRKTQLVTPAESVKTRITDQYGRLPLRFEANEGQTDEQVKFLSRGPGYDLFLTATGAVLTLRKPEKQRPNEFGAPTLTKDDLSSSATTTVLRLKMIGANPKALVGGKDELPGKVNYLIGDDPEKWHANIPTYLRVHYEDVYPGIDMVYYGNQQQLEYDFVIAPDADLRAVKFSLEGAQHITLEKTGDLVITIDKSEVKLRKPVIYQITEQGKRKEVTGSYVLKGSEVSFDVKDYDRRKPLIIDPILSYSTYFGPAATALAIAVDAAGNAYLTGHASAAIFPTTPGSFKPASTQDAPDAFVTKLNSTGTALIYSTFLGGSGQETGRSIAVDSSGNAFVTGETTSLNFPTVNAIRSSTSNFLKTLDAGGHWNGQFIGPPNGAVNVLVVDPLTPSTIYAGMGRNGGSGVYKTTDGGINWVGLNTGLTNVNCPALVIDPTTPSTLYAALNGDAPGSGLYKSVDAGTTWTRLTNGLSGVTVSALAIDPSLPSTLYAGSPSFSPLFKSINGGASWTNSSTGINYGISAIAVDPANSATVYVGAGFGGVFKTTNGGGNWNQVNTGLTNTFIRTLKFDSASNLYAGGSGGLFKSTNGGGNWAPLNNGLPAFTQVAALALNSNASMIFLGASDGRIYKTTDSGTTWNISYETLTRTSFNSLIIHPTNSSVVYAGASIESSSLNDYEAFVAKLNPNGSALVYSTYLGSNKDDFGRGIAVDSAGNAYVTGQTSSSTFPLAAAFQSTLKGTVDAFVTKLNVSGDALVYSTFLGGDSSETANGIATDGGGNAYITGSTGSSNFPLANPFQASIAETSFGTDAFVTKFSNTGALAYSTYLGGNSADVGYGIAVDSSGNAYVTGVSNSTNFPTVNSLSSVPGVFVTKLNNLGSGLVYSTYLGGTAGRGIAVDSIGNAYVTGIAGRDQFLLVPGALRTKSPFFKSFDGGGNWNNDNYGISAGAISMAVDPMSPSTIYLGTSAGIFKSTDGGNYWNSINNGLGNLRINEVVVNPITPSTLYAAAIDEMNQIGDGVYKSTNGGNSWTKINNGIVFKTITSLAIDPVTPTTLYAGSLGGGIYKTTNAGDTWTPPADLRINPAVSISIDPSAPNIIFGADPYSNGGIFRSADAGATWQRVGFDTMGAYGTFVGVNPVMPSTVYANTSAGLFKSLDGGNSWTLSSPTAFGKVVFDPIDSSIIYLLNTSQGILKSTDAGQSWKPINQGFRSVAAIALKVNPAKPSTLYAVLASPGDNDAFVSKINPSGSALVYSTLLGGSPNPQDSSGLSDEGYGIAVDPSGNAYVTGSTRALDFPTTPDSYLPIPVGGSFVSKLAMSYLISGRVTDAGNAPVSGAEVLLSDGATLRSVLTEGDGSYQFSQLKEGGSFTVTATKAHFTLSPPSYSFTNLNANQTANFTATATNSLFYTISGQVTNNGAALSGVTITLSGSQQGISTTDSNGNYSFTLAGGGNYTVTTSALGFTFNPPSLTFNNLSADQTASFAATRQPFVVTNANDHATGSLRQAILDANATPGLDTIVFNIPGSGVKTINLQLALPQITDPVVIDATTQPGYAGVPIIEINGAAVGTNYAGFWITAGGSTIRGFVLNRFGNTGFGAIYLRTNGSNIIQGNYIGLDSTGTLRSSNYGGVQISDSSNNLIGGTTTAARNVISGNSDGISVSGSNNQIMGNFIGTNAAGTAKVGNGSDGIVINGSLPATVNNVIGGTTPGAGNLISGNEVGISLNSSGVSVQGNLIGTDVSGTVAIGNSTGIRADGSDTLIGGTAPGAKNLISGNGIGVRMSGSQSRLEGNFIGTDITGTVALGNAAGGVIAGNHCLIGGTTPEARNVISGNGGVGNLALGYNTSGLAVTVQGNYIGTDVTGNVALVNPSAGIAVATSNHVIGGLVSGARNIISGNLVAIQIDGPLNVVQGNFIGLNATGNAPLPNSSDGVAVTNASNNTIGGLEINAGNTIAFNGGRGAFVSSGSGNLIRGNSIFSNSGLGIDLAPAGLTGNDPGDVDGGANNLQNFPVLTTVSTNGSTTTIQGTLNSRPNTLYRIDFYSSAACDPFGNGEGARFFDTTNVTTDAGGNLAINFTSSTALAPGRVITATATDPTGNTSEFSSCNSTNATGTVEFSLAAPKVLEDVGSASINVIRNGGSKGTLSVTYNTVNGTATAGSDYTAVSGTLVFAEGETTKTINIPIANDGVSEPDETVRLVLSATDLELLGSQPLATLTIQDNNTPLVLTMTSPLDIVEGDSGTTNAVVTVSLSAGTGRTVTANFATVAGSATSVADFTPVSGSLTFTSGVTTRTITIPIVGDILNEAIESFQVVLSSPTNASIGNSLVVRILNDDPLPALSISDTNIAEGNSGTVSAVFSISLSAVSGRSVIVFFSTANGSATAGTDYVANLGTSVVFSPGETLKTASITVNGDIIIEPNETFFVNLTSPTNATLARVQGVGMILNDDPSLQFSSPNYGVPENAGNATITITRADGAGTATVLFATSNGTATSADYTPVSETVTFNNGELSKTVSVPITNDMINEANETINLTLSNVSGPFFLGAPSTAVLTINDDDPVIIRFSSGNYSVAEGAGFTTITVERSGDTSEAVTVDYASSDHSNPPDFIPCNSPGAGFASSRCDFSTAVGTLRFAAGETSKTFNVLISQDNYVEGPETLNLTLSNPTGGAVFGVPQTAILSITDDVTEPATNPIDTSSEFVRSQYHDFLNREPDAPGLAFWTDNIEKCNDPLRRPAGQTAAQCIDKQRESTAVAFFMSPEFQITGGFVYHLYKGSLTGTPNYDGGSPGRFPTSLEFMRDVSQVSEGIVVNNQISGAVVEANRNRLAAEFVQRPEFVAKYGGLNNTLYVQELFNTTTITATAAQKQALVDGLGNETETKASVLRKIVDGTVVISEGNVQFTTTYGQAFSNQENRRVFVYMEYIGYLRRNPDSAGFVFWLGKLNFYNGDPFQAEMVRSFILAPEYRQRFGQP